MSYDEDPYDAGYAMVVAATDLALLVVILEEKFWVPRSVIHDDSDVADKGDEGHLVVFESWAEKGHLEDPVQEDQQSAQNHRSARQKFRR